MGSSSNMVLLNGTYFYRYLGASQLSMKRHLFPSLICSKIQGELQRKSHQLDVSHDRSVYLAAVSDDDVNFGTVLRPLLNIL